MNITGIKTQLRMQEWTKLIESQQESGLNIKQWCKQNNVHESQYYYYLKKLRIAACETLPSQTQTEAQFALVPEHARRSNPVVTQTSGMKITLSNAVIEICEGTSEVQLRSVLEVLLNAQ